jgi:parallel beta-helix repeat protein
MKVEKKISGILTAILLLSIVPTWISIPVDKNFRDAATHDIHQGDGTILYVGGTGPGNYTHIQDAIDNASDGDTVFVYNDSSPYYENLVVDKSINLMGEDRDTTIIDGRTEDADIVHVAVSQVKIKGFTIQHSTYLNYGIYIVDSHSNVISNCNLLHHPMDSMAPIGLMRSSNNSILNCNISDSVGGIEISKSNGNTISNCNLSVRNMGISLWGSSNNTISNCALDGERINIFESSNNIFSNCHIFNRPAEAPDGIQISYSTNNTFRGNILEHCGIIFNCHFPYQFNQDIDTSNLIDGKPIYYIIEQSNLEFNETMDIGYLGLASCKNITVKNLDLHGIALGYTSFTTIKNCSIYENTVGIYICGLGNNTVSNCDFSTPYPIGIFNSSQNVISKCRMTKRSLGFGIDINFYSNKNIVSNCYISNFDIGVCISGYCSNNIVENCHISNNHYGFFLACSPHPHNPNKHNFILNCDISNNECGIFASLSTNTTVSKCSIYNNEIGIDAGLNNSIYCNNIINNSVQAHNSGGKNQWDNGTMGNYWSDYNGIDLNRDGIGDVPYHIEGKNWDWYPLMHPYGGIITKPRRGYLYMADREIISTPFGNTIIIGGITINVATNDFVKVDFYVDNKLKNTDTEPPFQWKWNEKAVWKHTVKVVAYDDIGNTRNDEIDIVIFNLSEY